MLELPMNTESKLISWSFPLLRPQAGVVLGNGLQGILVWGEESLFITVGRAGFWDHRSGQQLAAGTTFDSVRAALEAGDEEALKRLFPSNEKSAAPFPQQLGGGRLKISFKDNLRPLDAILDLNQAVIRLRVGRDHEDEHAMVLRIRQHATDEICWLDGPEDWLENVSIELIPAFNLVHQDAMAQIGIHPPIHFEVHHGDGFSQCLPEDDPLALAWKKCGAMILLGSALGSDAQAKVVDLLGSFDSSVVDEQRSAFWEDYWQHSASVLVPDELLQRQYDIGLYKQAGILREHAPAATLQGPWMEDTRIPPWSNDYHFNINLQMIYGAAQATGHSAKTTPLWAMLQSWLPQLKAMGEAFYQREGAMLLPHALDDRCRMMGSFWSGTIDQACIAWMGRMSYQHFAVTGDREHLREVTWPLLEGAYHGYVAMADFPENELGQSKVTLPVSVSPEFGGSDLHACWGKDASFQLAAFRCTIELMQRVSQELAMPVDPKWTRLLEGIPHYTTVPAVDGSYGWIGGDAVRIALWDGQDLTESHRHHSHLAAIYPFCTIDPLDPAHQKTIARTINRWNTMGAGNWTGWCIPWAAAICARCGLPDAALSWLQLLAIHFTNEGHATLHNADGAGVFAWDDGSLAWPDHRKGADFHFYEVMQMDATMGAVSAILEMLISMRGEVVHIADRLPKGWRDASFKQVRMEGGFIVSATFKHARVDSVHVRSQRVSCLMLDHGLGEKWTMNGSLRSGQRLIYQMEAGEEISLQRHS